MFLDGYLICSRGDHGMERLTNQQIALVASGGLLGSQLIVGIISFMSPVWCISLHLGMKTLIPFQDYSPQRWHQFLIYIGYNIAAFCINAFGNRLLPWVTRGACQYLKVLSKESPTDGGSCLVNIRIRYHLDHSTRMRFTKLLDGGVCHHKTSSCGDLISNATSFVFREFINETGCMCDLEFYRRNRFHRANVNQGRMALHGFLEYVRWLGGKSLG